MHSMVRCLIATFAILLNSDAIAGSNENSFHDWKAEGQTEFNARHFDKAYELWRIDANEGDPDTQEKVAMMLFRNQVDSREFRENRRNLALQFLIRSALNGQISAMRRLSTASFSGRLGLRINQEAAKCWADAAKTGRSSAECAGKLNLLHMESRPRCAQLSMMDDRFVASDGHGADVAKKCIAIKTLAIMVPGPPPGQIDEIKKQEYERYGIERIVTGDTYDEKFEAFRQGFNTTMNKEILARLGIDTFDKINAAIQLRADGR